MLLAVEMGLDLMMNIDKHKIKLSLFLLWLLLPIEILGAKESKSGDIDNQRVLNEALGSILYRFNKLKLEENSSYHEVIIHELITLYKEKIISLDLQYRVDYFFVLNMELDLVGGYPTELFYREVASCCGREYLEKLKIVKSQGQFSYLNRKDKKNINLRIYTLEIYLKEK